MSAKVVRRGLAPLAVGLGAFLIASCGPPGAPYVDFEDTGATLEGTVTMKGEPLQVGMVIVQGAAGGGNTASVDEQGKYKITRVPIGEAMIGVGTRAVEARLRGEAMGGAIVYKDAKGLKKAPPKVVHVPQKYEDPSKSGLKTTIQLGENKFDIVIE